MEFIMILIVSIGGGTSPTSQAVLFPTQAACMNAKKRTEEEFGVLGRYVKAICVPRHLDTDINQKQRK
jgi:hypothetical protein